MINEPFRLRDIFSPMRQQNLIDHANENSDLTPAGNAESISTGRGRGIVIPPGVRAYLKVWVNLTTAQTGANAYNCGIGVQDQPLPDGSATVTASDLFTFPDTDDAIFYDMGHRSTFTANYMLLDTNLQPQEGWLIGRDPNGKYTVIGIGDAVGCG